MSDTKREGKRTAELALGESFDAESLPPMPIRQAPVAPRGARALAPLSHPEEDLLPTGFERWRSELDHLSGMKLLDAMLAPANAEACVQTLPLEDLHRHLFAIGLEDSDALLALASKEQVKGLLDMETWEGFLPSLERMDVWLHALMRAGDDVLYRHMQAMDDELLSWVLQRNMVAFVVEDPESFSPPDQDHFMSPNRDLCVVFHREDNDAPAQRFVNMYMEAEPEQCITFLLGATSALPSVIEEEAYRWRTVRMSERGFIERYEALEIYNPPSADWKRSLAPERVNDEAPPARHWLAHVVAPDARLDAAFASLSWESAMMVMEHLGYVANRMMSADAVELWDEDAQAEVLVRLRAALNLALELINGREADAALDAELFERHYLAELFKLGYERMVEAARPVWRVEAQLKRGEDPSGALADLPQLKALADGLLKAHPEGSLGGPLLTLADCELAREGAELIQDIARVAQTVHAEHLVDVLEGDAVHRTGSDSDVADRPSLGAELLAAYGRHLFGLKGYGPLPQERLSDFLTRALSSELSDVGALTSWWLDNGGQLKGAPLALVAELREQVGAVPVEEVDPRFVPLLWVG